jgi:hypothetical protein
MKLPYLTDPKQLVQWAQQLVRALTTRPFPEEYPGPFASDAAAATAGVPVGNSYMDNSGFYRRRLT